MTIQVDGKTHIKRYLAGFEPSIAQSIAFGLGDKAEANTDTALQFEVGRADIVLTSYDFVNDRLIFKAPVPNDFGGWIYEVALFSAPANDAAGEFGSRIITTFDSGDEDWVDAASGLDSTFATTNVRIGDDALRHTPIASGNQTDALREISLDLSGYSAADKFVLALNAVNGNASSVGVQFMTDTSNYYTVTFTGLTTGYKILSATKGSAVATGTPNWSNIIEIRIKTNSGAGGASNLAFDGLRIEDVDTINADYVMVSRELLAAPFQKQEGMTQDIEFTLNVSI